VNDKRVFIFPLSFIVKVSELIKGQYISVFKFCQINNPLFGGVFINDRINFLHFPIGIDTVVV